MYYYFFFKYLFSVSTPSCINDKLKQHETDIQNFNAHIKHRPVRTGDLNHLPYVGNGFFGLSDSESEQNFYISAAGHYRTLSVPVQFKPIVHILSTDFEDSQSAKVCNTYVFSQRARKCKGSPCKKLVKSNK